MIRIYDTFLGKKRTLKRSGNKPLRFFVCGPTVYDYSHIGHARTYIAFDTIVRYVRWRGEKIVYLQNITDVDDKIINRARERRKNPLLLAHVFEKAHYEDMKILGIESVDYYARATDHLPEILKQIKTLFKKGFAYETNNGVYFEVRKFKPYGKLSRQDIEKVRHGWRIEPDPQKKDPLDFALWKKITAFGFDAKSQKLNKGKGPVIFGGEPAWWSPWSWGRPGWHIEDTAISERYFGAQYDLHGGAGDLKFPHHESEIAQQEAASGKKPFVKIWMHTGFLLIRGEKMSKSLGNFITIRDFLNGSAKKDTRGAQTRVNTLRFLVMSHHYRSPVDYNDELVEQSRQSVIAISEFLEKLRLVQREEKGRIRRIPNSQLRVGGYKREFKNAMDDDFNTPVALAAIFNLIHSLQDDVWYLRARQAREVEHFIREAVEIFGLMLESLVWPRSVKGLLDEREGLRANKQFIQADALRKKVESLGYKVEDTPIGPLLLPGQ